MTHKPALILPFLAGLAFACTPVAAQTDTESATNTMIHTEEAPIPSFGPTEEQIQDAIQIYYNTHGPGALEAARKAAAAKDENTMGTDTASPPSGEKKSYSYSNGAGQKNGSTPERTFNNIDYPY